ncbi:ABC transporter permease [Candidatus Sumerlaeota bacterium]|nr:ABC transporter permease [Candidatus Sumerlaeota bacterium]
MLRSILAVVVVSWAVATATFILMKSVPGGPLSRERKLPDAVRKAIEEKYHLNDPVLIQYRDYLMDAAAFRFGLSFDDPGRTVGEIILQRLPRSMILGALALGISLTLAFILGTAAAVWRGRWPDRLLALTASAGVSVPSFILGSLLLYWFSYRIRLFPAGGWDGFSYAILPAISLAALPTAYLARLVRAGLAEVMRAEFMLAARARGLSELQAVVIHGLRHTLSPVLAYLGPQAAAIMTGSFVVEKIFNVPGLGMMYVQSIGNRNYPMIMGVTLVYTVMLVVFNLLSDLAARLLDPRLRQG